jgi:hypothetical protein
MGKSKKKKKKKGQHRDILIFQGIISIHNKNLKDIVISIKKPTRQVSGRSNFTLIRRCHGTPHPCGD